MRNLVVETVRCVRDLHSEDIACVLREFDLFPSACLQYRNRPELEKQKPLKRDLALTYRFSE